MGVSGESINSRPPGFVGIANSGNLSAKISDMKVRSGHTPDLRQCRARRGTRHTRHVPNCIHGIDDRFCAVCTNKGRPKPGKRQTVEAKAAAHNPATDLERESFEALYAYEAARSTHSGRTFRSSRTWQVVESHGVVPAVERLVGRPDDAGVSAALLEMGMQDMAFEHVVVRHREAFSEKAVLAADARLKRLKA